MYTDGTCEESTDLKNPVRLEIWKVGSEVFSCNIDFRMSVLRHEATIDDLLVTSL